MTVGSLFSGIGGFDLGLERAGFSIEWQVENNDYCREVLKKHWPAVPCHYDIRSIDWEYIPRVDLVCGGFPCQPFSCAGKRQGKDDDRYLWPEVVRCLTVLRPTWFLGENVYGLLHLGIEQVCADLEALGYQVAILGIPACAVDAPHIRKRLWILAHTESDLWGASRDEGPETFNGSHSPVAHTEGERLERGCDREEWQQEKSVRLLSPRSSQRDDVADSDGSHEHRRDSHVQMGRGRSAGKTAPNDDTARDEWCPEPDVGGMVDGLSQKLDEGGLNGNEMDGEKAGAARCAEPDKHELPTMWDNKEFGTSPSELCGTEQGRESMPAVPHHSGSARRNQESETGKAVQGVQQAVSPTSQQKTQHMQQGMSGRNRKNKRDEEMASWPQEPADIPRVEIGVKNRVDRLKGLGNAIVPQIAEALGRMILEVRVRKGE